MFTLLKQSVRILSRYGVYTTISVLGLATAVVSSWFISDYITRSSSFDQFHPNYENIYRLSIKFIAGGSTDHYATTGSPPGYLLANEYPEFLSYSMLSFHSGAFRIDDEVFSESDFYSTNPETLEVFYFDFISGSKQLALAQPNSIILSRSIAIKYFGSTDILGKELLIENSLTTITGVFEDWPANTHIRVNALISKSPIVSFEAQDWGNLENYTYLLASPDATKETLERQLEQVYEEHLAPALDGSGITAKLEMQPLQSIYYAAPLNDDTRKGNFDYVMALLYAGIFMLVLATLNYVNLNLTKSLRRTKEFKLKKILGVSRGKLFSQLLVEGTVSSSLILLVAVIIILILDPVYSQFTGYNSLTIASNWLLMLVLFTLITLLNLAGSALSNIQISFSSLAPTNGTGQVSITRKLILGSQFLVAAVLLMFTMSIRSQIEFMRNKDLGYSSDAIMIVKLPAEEPNSIQVSQLKSELKKFPDITAVSSSGGGTIPGEDNGKDLFEVDIDGVRTEKIFNNYVVDEDYLEILGIDVLEGRNFDSNRIGDKQKVLINEALAKSMNWPQPLGQSIWCYGEEREVIGVVSNFHNKSLHNLIEPILFLNDDEYSSNLLVKGGPTAIEHIESAYKTAFPESYFDLIFFDRFLDNLYAEEDNLLSMFRIFSIIALLICSTGLFALFSIHIVHKTREVSIRKVLGAGPMSLIKIVTRDYIYLIVSAVVVAAPLASYFRSEWLEGFIYSVNFQSLDFAIPIGLLLLSCAVTIGYHVFWISSQNPADSLKQE